ncbi:MAG: hypothetical protein GX033_00205 [Firmicutes bacterium]|nr:hypothetical protein [Bacillota bacterium]
MLKTIQQWWSGSWLVHILEGLALGLVAAWHGCWLGRFLAQPWDDSAPQFLASGVQRFWQGLASGRQRLARRLQSWLSTSYFLGRWPEWLASDLAWVWHGSFLRRFLGQRDGETVGKKELADTPDAPPLCRLLLYVVLVGLLLAAALMLPQGMTLLKWAGLGVVLALVWARPNASVGGVAFLLPVLPILSTTIIILVAFGARLCREEPFFPRGSWVRTLGGLFCLVGLAAALASAHALAALRFWRYYLAAYLFLILLMDTLRTQQAIDQVVSWGLLGASFVAILSIWQYIGGVPTNLSWVDIRVSAVTTRVVGTFDNPNMLAGYLVAWLPFPVSWFLAKESSSRRRLVSFLAAGLLGLSLILTFSRGGWLAFAAALFIIVACQEPRLFWAVPVLLLAAPFVLPPVIWQRLASIVNLEDTSNMVRRYVWDSSAKMFFANWLLGIGQGLVPFARVYPVYQFGVVPALHAHSLILQLAVESGVISLLLFLWICIALWRLAMRNWQAAPKWTVPLGAALAGHLVHGIFDHTWYDLRVMLVFWLLVALATAVARQLGEAK